MRSKKAWLTALVAGCIVLVPGAVLADEKGPPERPDKPSDYDVPSADPNYPLPLYHEKAARSGWIIKCGLTIGGPARAQGPSFVIAASRDSRTSSTLSITGWDFCRQRLCG